ncbi:MAG: ABC-2 family transporter protein [Chloroflexia bacterium]|nr:ABC-2 family transporter protein [Chloroflexia bacterium]
MRFSWNIYRRLVGVQIRGQMQYRLSFFMDLLGTALITTLTFVSLALVFQRFQDLGGWTLGEVAFLYGLVETAFGLMDMFFSGFDPPFFGRLVRQGAFDQLLLRPVSTVAQVLGARFVARRLGRIVQGVIILAIALSWVEINWTLGKALYLPMVAAGQVLFFGGLFIVGSAITFWTVESIEVVNIFTYGGSEMMSYPMHIYPDWMRRFFTFVLPAILMNYYPALYFLDKPDPFGLPAWAPFLAPPVGLGVMALALAFWRFGLRHYQSTGS